MRKFTRIRALLLTLVCTMASWAAVPFETTTIEDGQFATGTKWYTVSIGAAKLLLTDTEDKTSMELKTALYTGADAELWCFTGNETDGFKLHNKQAGATKVLASPKTMSGAEGGTAYAVMKEESALGADYLCTYDLSASTSIASTEGFYIAQHGIAANKLNNRQGLLAFWTGGQDAGSTFIIAPASVNITVSKTTGEFTATNPAGNWASNWASSGTPQININSGANNMAWDGNNLKCAGGTSGSSTYTINAGAGFVVTGFSFDFVKSSANAATVNAGGKTYTATADKQNITLTGLDKQTASFSITGGNNTITLTDFVVTIGRSTIQPEPQVEIFTTKPGLNDNVPYRIPAIATASNGNILAVADFRYSGMDIGMATNGKLDLHYRLSKDNGKTWTENKVLVAGRGAEGIDPELNDMWVAFGDPIAVADRESNRMLVMSCSGNVSFPNGQRDHHQGIARFYSEDNGETWSEPVDISEDIYTQFDKRKAGPIRCMFIGSGKMTQSHTTKVGDYYRIYNAALVKLGDGTNANFVFYSDDFGMTWHVLGGVDNAPIPAGGDEPKAEELPDGSILISSRCTGGRYYNIYTFTNSATGEGSWSKMAFSGASNNGVTALGNSCNGEILVLPVTRKADGKNMFLLLQSVPFGNGRSNVGIYYKGLESIADFVTPDSIAANWDGRHQASYIGSAYSTMTLQADNTIGFLYEESTYARDYTILYKNYSVEQITDSLYTINADFTDRDGFTAAGIDKKLEHILAGGNFGPYLGQYKEEARTAINEALAAYKAAPSKAAYEALNAAVANAPVNTPATDKLYTIRNKERVNGTLYLKPATVQSVASYTGFADDNAAENRDLLFQFVPSATNGEFYLYSPHTKVYMGPTEANEVKIGQVKTTGTAGSFSLHSSTDGLTAFVCSNKKGSNEAIHLAGDNQRLVTWLWGTSNGPSFWYVEAVGTTTDIENVVINSAEQLDNAWFDLHGRRVAKPANGIFVNRKGRKQLFK